MPWEGRTDFDIRIFEVGTRKVIGVLSGLAGKVSPRELHYSEDETMIITPLESGPVVIWDARRLCRHQELTGEPAAGARARFRAILVVNAHITGRLEAPETIFTGQSNGRDVAWYPHPLHDLTRHPSGKMWAGCSHYVSAHQNEARKIDMVAIEGAV